MSWKETYSGRVLNLLEGVEPQIADLNIKEFRWLDLEFIKFIISNADIEQSVKDINPKTSNWMYLALINEITNPDTIKPDLQIDPDLNFIRIMAHKTRLLGGKMLVDKIKEDHKNARMGHDKELSGKLGALLSEIQKSEEKNQSTDNLTDDKIIEIILYFKKGALQNYEATSDPKYKTETEIYDKYLPKLMTDAEVDQALGLFLGLEPKANIGKCMNHFKNNYAGRYNPKDLSQKLREIL